MIRPRNLQAVGTDIAVLWEDGIESYYPMELLRSLSPSAENAGERDLLGHLFYGGTGKKEFTGVTVTNWQPVGGYAVQFFFSDGHNTGIYTYDYLREIWSKLAAADRED